MIFEIFGIAARLKMPQHTLKPLVRDSTVAAAWVGTEQACWHYSGGVISASATLHYDGDGIYWRGCTNGRGQLIYRHQYPKRAV